MSKFIEGKLEFEFNPTIWNVRKWDGESAYRKGIALLEETKALDFLAIRSEHLLGIEVKDFRDHRIENKARIEDGKLAVEVAQKVRDTLAGVIGAVRMRDNGDGWAPFIKAASDPKRPLHVILWLEEDRPSKAPPGAGARSRNTFEQHLKKQLRWLTTHVFVASMQQTERLADVSVRNL